MKIKLLLIVLINLAFCSLAHSQFVVTVNQMSGFNCIDSSMQFVAITTENGVVVEGVDYIWELDGGIITNTVLTNDTLQVKYDNGGGHIIRVDASKGGNNDYALLKVEVALEPNFYGTKSNRDEPICKGQRISLTGKINDSTWVYNVPDTIAEESPVELSDTKEYNGAFDYRIFAEDQSVTFAEDIDSIGINMEHSNLSQVKIELICPDGNSIILKDFGGADIYMGEPIDDDDNTEQEGVGYDYYFINNPDNGTMNSFATGATLPSGSYTSEEPFSNLTGCSLNGEWKIKITDNTENDNGFIFLTRLSFEESQLPADWEFSHTYKEFDYEWSGDGYVSSTNPQDLIALAIPDSYGGQRYTFTAVDDFNCPQDTFVDVTVEPVDMDVEPVEGPFNKPFNFSTTVSWAVEYDWIFGDTDDDTYTTIENKYDEYYYEEEGTYIAKLVATTDDGCSDTASVNVLVTIPEHQEVDMKNAFSPDGDGTNDEYRIVSVDFIESIECWIYSRWGKRVAKWENVGDAEKGWDGRINGSGREASPGVYYYVLKGKTFAGKTIDKNGSFHLIRK